MLNEILKCGYVIKRRDNELYFLEKKVSHYDPVLEGEIDIKYEIIFNKKLKAYKTFDDFNLELEIKKNKNKGFVYLVKLGERYKIGYTKNLVQRMTFFENTFPEYPELINYIITKHYKKLEIIIHNYFKEKREKNEWFCLTKEDLYIFDKIKNYYF